nr:MAG TPA: hypothetical protein [Caudoviricetes sp.]
MLRNRSVIQKVKIHSELFRCFIPNFSAFEVS